MKIFNLTLVTLMVALSGCGNKQSMVVSYQMGSNTIEGGYLVERIRSGMLYSLPKQLIKVTYSRKLIDSTKAAKEVADLKKLLKSKNDEVKEKNKEIGKLQVLKDKLDLSAENSALVLQKYQKEILIAKTQKLSLRSNINSIKQKLHSASINYNLSLQSDEAFDEQLKITAEDTITDDPWSFSANLNHSRSRSDSLELTIKNGLLDGAVGSTEDKTGEIISSLAGALSGLKRFSGINKSGNVTAMRSLTDLNNCKKDKAISVTQVIDPDVDNDYVILNRRLHAGCISICTDNIRPRKLKINKKSNGEIPGLVYRQPGLYSFYINNNDSKQYSNTGKSCSNTHEAIQTVKLNLAQGGRVGYIEMPKGRFSKNDYDVSFSKGMLAKNKIVRPSEVVGAISIIPNALKEIISIPAELIQLKVNYSTSEKDLIELQKTIIQAELEIEKRQQELDALLNDNGLPTVLLLDPDDD